MYWMRDYTGRFLRRPYYEPHELDSACESIVTEFLLARYGKVTYPISTDDLTIMLEKEGVDLDLYTDFPKEEEDVEGVTEFALRDQPRVKIARRISEAPKMENRFRTTIAHEYFHVKFHGILFRASERSRSLTSGQHKAVCKRQSIVSGDDTDWMEWQAGYGCGALLMPMSALKELVRIFSQEYRIIRTPIDDDSLEARELIRQVMLRFHVSHHAATIRLLQSNAITNQPSFKTRIPD
jgi:hypothetical protein